MDKRIWRPAVLVLGIVGLACGTAAGQAGQAEQTTTQAKSTVHFEVLAVQGNTVTVKTREKGAEDITVDDNFRFTVDGNPVSVHDLKPGMKGTATVTTTTTYTPVVITEIHEGTVHQVSGNSIIVRTNNGFRMFTEGDAAARGATIIRNGEPSNFASLRRGDRLTATVVTTHPPKVMTKRQVDAAMASPAAVATAGTPAGTPGGAPAAAGQQPAAGHEASAAAEPGAPAQHHHKKLPKTASVFPLIGLAGASLCGIALMLGVARRRAA
jgi:hypothetical protein